MKITIEKGEKRKKTKRVLNPKIVKAKDKVVDTVKGIDGSKVATMVVGVGLGEIVKMKIHKD